MGISLIIALFLEYLSKSFEEIDHYFEVTLFHGAKPAKISEEWEKTALEYLNKHKKITAKQAQQVWSVTSRTTSTRLKKMCEKGLIVADIRRRITRHQPAMNLWNTHIHPSTPILPWGGGSGNRIFNLLIINLL